MDEQDRATLAQDEHPAEHLAAQAAIQDVLDELARTMAGDPVPDVTVAINRRLADAGIPEQPHRWVEGMAERISTGRPPVADTRAAVDTIRETASSSARTEPAEPVEPESVEPGAGVEGQATPPPASPR